ncbi:MAG: Maf family protein, partial [Chloroflexi bacterium]|nr:Maf family protein [Chloroflexota bacterium]
VLIIAADTIVVDEGKKLGKPKNKVDAKRILIQLMGKTHQVMSGIALFQPSQNKILSRMVPSEVAMREYTESEIQDYINSGDPMDKAGAYGIQNSGFNPAPAFNECYANVMGLPLCHLSLLMKEMGYEGNDLVAERCQESIQYQCPVYLDILSGNIGPRSASRKL